MMQPESGVNSVGKNDEEERHVRFINLTQDFLSNVADDNDFMLMRAAWTFRQHLTKWRGRQTPSRLPGTLADGRVGQLDPATLEAKFYKQGGTRAENAFLAALKEFPFDGSPSERVQLSEAILKRGGEHAIQAYHAAEHLLEAGKIDEARSLICDYGGIQALTMYAVVKTSDPSVVTLICDLSASHISRLLDCVSNVCIHRDVSYMIETLFRSRGKPTSKPKKTHVGRATRSRRSRKRDQDLPESAPLRSVESISVPDTVQERRDEIGSVGLCIPGAANHIGHQPQRQDLATARNRQLEQSACWSDPSARETDITMEETSRDLLPERNDGILSHPDYIEILEQDLSLFVEANFHFPEGS